MEGNRAQLGSFCIWLGLLQMLLGPLLCCYVAHLRRPVVDTAAASECLSTASLWLMFLSDV